MLTLQAYQNCFKLLCYRWEVDVESFIALLIVATRLYFEAICPKDLFYFMSIEQNSLAEANQ
jgi:hypothetical protein